jgi:hypothetical protein
MLYQEDLCQLIFKKDWKEILTFLPVRKKEILPDPLLRYAADIFQQELFKD